MKYSDINIFCCPECQGRLEFCGEVNLSGLGGSEDVSEGSIRCLKCDIRYPLEKGIPRFSPRNNYAQSFFYQWKRFASVQTGRKAQVFSERRFNETTKWPQELSGQTILEAGCGAGRFSGIILSKGARLYSFDLSDAVEVNMDNLKEHPMARNVHLFQADILKIPLPLRFFDKIICLGVLQHCPDPKKAYLALVPFLKSGGELVADCYLKYPFMDLINPKYILRPFLKWLSPQRLLSFCAITVSLAYTLKSALAKIPLVGEHICRMIPIGVLDYGPYTHFTIREIKEIKTLSMYDMLSPKYDKPQNISSFKKWMQEADLEILELGVGYNGINARGRKK